ncbi:MAG: LL-diaminopimelate aminotransferase [Candidatus Omnitrophota bacterium]
MMNIEFSDRLKKLPPYLFVEIDKAKRAARAQGRDIIDLGIGDPDTPTPDFIIEAMNKATKDPANHRYALDNGLLDLRKAIAEWMNARFNVTLDTEKEIHPLIGSKDGIAHLPLALINPGDVVLVPDPRYPPYYSGSIFAGAKVKILPLEEKNGFLPDLKAISARGGSAFGGKKAKLIFVCYPNNPTASVASRDFYRRLVDICLNEEIIIASDAAYSEIYYDNEKPPSILEIEGSRDIAIEFHSLSKTYNMTGWRIGWACGNEKLIAALAKVKSNVDSGIFQAIQVAGIAALQSDQAHPEKMRKVYCQRRDALIDGLVDLGWQVAKPKATFYIWAKIPKQFKSSMEFAKLLLDKCDVIATPGVGFGEFGEGYIRFALTVGVSRIKEAVSRIGKLFI